jgi:hypothetical protein
MRFIKKKTLSNSHQWDSKFATALATTNMEVDDSSLSPSCLNYPCCFFFLQLQLDEPTMENNATIICWVHHDDSLFPIEIDPGKIIGLLKEAIFAKKRNSFGAPCAPGNGKNKPTFS